MVNGDEPGARRYMTVVQEILAAIGSDRLAPGDRLPNERELAAMCGTSRPTVRDALLALELFGVVEVRPGSGCYVTDHGASRRAGSATLLEAPPRELLEAREQVEPAVVRLCAQRITKEQIRHLSDLIDRSDEEARRATPGQLETFLRLTHQFHVDVAAVCGNSILADVTRQLVDVTAHPLWMIVNGLVLRDEEARLGQVREHRAVLDAMVGGNAEGAAAAMSFHLNGLWEDIFGRPRPSGQITRRRRGSAS